MARLPVTAAQMTRASRSRGQTCSRGCASLPDLHVTSCPAAGVPLAANHFGNQVRKEAHQGFWVLRNVVTWWADWLRSAADGGPDAAHGGYIGRAAYVRSVLGPCSVPPPGGQHLLVAGANTLLARGISMRPQLTGCFEVPDFPTLDSFSVKLLWLRGVAQAQSAPHGLAGVRSGA